jgi:type VI secretion system FHA domain protein
MWTLLLSNLADPPGVYFDRRQFDGGVIKIGRSAKTCDIVLPNDDGLISREHCTISASGFDLFVTDTSTNGVALNDPQARILPRQPVAVRVRDRLIVQSFVITILTAAEGASVGLAPMTPHVPEIPGMSSGAQDDIWSQAPADSFWQSGAGGGDAFGLGGGFSPGLSGPGSDHGLVHDFLSGGNAFFDQPAGAAHGAPDRPQHPADFGFSEGMGEAFLRPIMADSQPIAADFDIPEDWASAFGPIDGPVGGGALSAQSFAPPPAAPLPPVSPSLVPSPPPPPPPPPPPHHDTAADPFAMPGGFGGADIFGDSGFGDPGAFAPEPFPAPAAEPRHAAPPPHAAPIPAAQQPVAGPDWSAFYEGAGLTPQDLPLAPDAMFKLGQLYRQVVLGMCDILQDRAAFKDEFRVERTQLSIGRNNPLKHLSAIEAAKVLLGQPLPGFMGMEEAVRTSLEDLKKHQLAMLAGVQNALLVVFDRLSPAEIERFAQKVENQKKGMLGRRAPDRWAVFVTVFEALRRDATGNANGVMSVAFREGYENFMKSVR